ncbi:MAG: septal ring lytic transglycosylase RlpA family protein [Gemmatimonadetes bacterium]|nr:septal ring lytic transglycosylase RlpA family protein [Gemmatimonadota bacterium]NNF12849.1 septal ring lytic transglycosylase RlpA family protein [Gemmatimonadota bacterium]
MILGLASMAGCTLVGAAELERGRTPGAATGGSEATASGGSSPRPTVEAPARYGNMEEYEQSGRTYRVLETSQGYDERGVASWYGEKFHGRRTSSGEPFDMHAPSAAHRTLPLPSWVRVTNLANGRSTLLRVNDRGPFADPDERILDVSYAAALRLGMVEMGTAAVRVEAVEPWQYRSTGR